ncbi:MAG: cation:proton antiporter [Acidimicrobiales bacterium]|nr:cation:proton antiporter [Acidimicrobiales bacterium]MCB1028059.1 cation:proton antiporter [Microthrixaceae bacterium]
MAFIELGALVIGLGVLARLSHRVGLSPIPAYLAAGLIFGTGGLAQINFADDFIDLASEIGVLLLLFVLGLEYTGAELTDGLRKGWRSGCVDLALNFTPGLVAGLLLGWGPLGALMLAGVTYISSSGVVSKLLGDLDRMANRETPSVLTILVFEDLVMAAYLPVLGVLLVGGSVVSGAISVGVALSVTALVLVLAIRMGGPISALLSARSDEALLLSVMGLILVVGGLAQRVQVSAAIGAFLVGIALSGEVRERAEDLLTPLRDLFAALFFVLFSLRIDPGDLPPVLVAAALLAGITALTKIATGRFAARQLGVGPRGRDRAGMALVARGEFSIVIAGLAAGTVVDSALAPTAAAYVLILAVVGPLLARFNPPVPSLDSMRRRLARWRSPDRAVAGGDASA